MIQYNKTPLHEISSGSLSVNSFVDKHVDNGNIDWNTVDSFGQEWGKFDQFSLKEIEAMGDEYFDIAKDILNTNMEVLEVGSGSGRWMYYLSNKVKFIEGIDPSNCVMSASKFLKDKKNTRITQAEVDHIPFANESFDLVYSLGVLHHIPNSKIAMQCCVDKVKKGGYFLVYLYYNLDNRSLPFKLLFKLSNIIRLLISKMPFRIKSFACDILAILFYMPFVLFSKFVYLLPMARHLIKYIPLSYYRTKSFNVIRNDSLDRFGTPLEQRFSKIEIKKMMETCGLSEIIFSTREPYWHAIGKKAN